ncbi:coiled-coil domain-containing protein [Helicobacter bizzozeronii]|uniref:hypothetical protein n=1 Tax=Helicobacter bizzozeronii TaxID=56877 RepID=UPI000CF186E0|nr:hypothetical protein [Helicobacter bizzozeronii]
MPYLFYNTLQTLYDACQLQNDTRLPTLSLSLYEPPRHLKNTICEFSSLQTFLQPLDSPNKQNKKLTIKEAKPLLESVRKQMIIINRGLGNLKLFTQEDYKALRGLKDEGLSIADLKARIATIEQEAKTRYQALQEQYKDYLSPSAVQELKQEHAKELEMKEQSYTETLESKDTEHTKALQEKQKEIDALKNENAQKDGNINGLKEQIAKHTQELENSKQEIATLKTTSQELQQENLKLKPIYLTKAQIRSRRLAERQELMGKSCPKEAFKELGALDDEKLTQAQLDERILNIWLKYAPSYIASLETTNTSLEQETQALKAELKTAKAEAKSQAHIKVFEREATSIIRKYVSPITAGVVAHIQASAEKITDIHKQCQEQMFQQASTCALLNEEMLAGKHTAINAIARLFGKGVKKEYKLDYDPIKAKTGYRELNRREQAIKKI